MKLWTRASHWRGLVYYHRFSTTSSVWKSESDRGSSGICRKMCSIIQIRWLYNRCRNNIAIIASIARCISQYYVQEAGYQKFAHWIDNGFIFLWFYFMLLIMFILLTHLRYFRRRMNDLKFQLFLKCSLPRGLFSIRPAIVAKKVDFIFRERNFPNLMRLLVFVDHIELNLSIRSFSSISSVNISIWIIMIPIYLKHCCYLI